MGGRHRAAIDVIAGEVNLPGGAFSQIHAICRVEPSQITGRVGLGVRTTLN